MRLIKHFDSCHHSFVVHLIVFTSWHDNICSHGQQKYWHHTILYLHTDLYQHDCLHIVTHYIPQQHKRILWRCVKKTQLWNLNKNVLESTLYARNRVIICSGFWLGTCIVYNHSWLQSSFICLGYGHFHSNFYRKDLHFQNNRIFVLFIILMISIVLKFPIQVATGLCCSCFAPQLSMRPQDWSKFIKYSQGTVNLQV